MKFSEKIKNLRQSAGLTQQQLSVHIGITASAIGYLENGQRDPTGSTLIAYAKFFNVSIDSLVGLEPDIEDSIFSITPPAPLPPDTQELVNIYQVLSPAHRSQILEYARYFAEKSGAASTRRKA